MKTVSVLHIDPAAFLSHNICDSLCVCDLECNTNIGGEVIN